MENWNLRLSKNRIWILMVSSLLLVSCSPQFNKLSTEDSAPKQSLIDESKLDIITESDFFEIDKFENIYWVNGNKLFLKDVRNKREYLYENDRLGNISSIDVINPQKILVFYDDFDFVIILDNALSERSEIDLKTFELTDVNAIALSNDNNLWLYDPISFQLKKIDNRGFSLAQSLPLISYNLGVIDPIKIIEDKNSVYLLDDSGILIFDNLGQYIKLIPFDNITDFQVANNGFIYLDGKIPSYYDMSQLISMPIEGFTVENESPCLQFRKGIEKQYLRFSNGIQIIE